MSEEVVVAIPVHNREMTTNEAISYARCIEILTDHKIVLVAPAELDLTAYQPRYRGLEVLRFDPRFFSGIDGYNRLMLTTSLYKKLADHKYVLVHQLDAFVFSDQLLEWCAKGYHYIGAPWPRGLEAAPLSMPFRRSRVVRQLFPLWVEKRRYFVGNGGFSLRHVRSCIKLLCVHLLVAKLWNGNEDIFFAFFGGRRKWFDIPGPDIARKFSFEQEPRNSLELNQGNLPFGCHAWARWDIDFWRPIFHSLGYAI